MFQFVKDHKAQGNISGPFRPLGDQSKFRSIWGCVDGPQTGAYTGHQIESGEIYSADGRARLGGTAFKDDKGKFHEVKSGSTTFREYLVPLKSVENWNKYEAQQGNEMQDKFLNEQRSKAARAGFAEIEENLEVIDEEPIRHETVAAQPKRERTPEQIQAARDRMAAVRAAKKTKA